MGDSLRFLPGRLRPLLLALASVAAAACAIGGTPAGTGSNTGGAVAAQRPAERVAEAQPALPPATIAVAPPPPTVQPTAVPTVAPTATAAPPHLLSVAAMRGREYPGSDLVVEENLAPGVNYTRQIVSYRSEGLKIYALLTVPRGQKPPTGWPVIVFNHGFIPPKEYRTTERYIAYTDAFSRNGYIVLKSDYRGHGVSEGTAGGGYGAPDYVVDVMNALASIERYPDADPNRIGMWGHSMGGYVTLRAMVITPRIKAGVIWAGVVGSYPDLIYNWNGRPPTSSLGVPPANATPGRPLSWRDQLIVGYGRPEQNPGFWASISSSTYLRDLSGPLQLHHGTADHSVPLQMSVNLDQQVRQAGGQSELFTYPGDDHNIAANLGAALSRSVAFFDAHVKNQLGGAAL